MFGEGPSFKDGFVWSCVLGWFFRETDSMVWTSPYQIHHFLGKIVDRRIPCIFLVVVIFHDPCSSQPFEGGLVRPKKILSIKGRNFQPTEKMEKFSYCHRENGGKTPWNGTPGSTPRSPLTGVDWGYHPKGFSHYFPKSWVFRPFRFGGFFSHVFPTKSAQPLVPGT